MEHLNQVMNKIDWELLNEQRIGIVFLLNTLENVVRTYDLGHHAEHVEKGIEFLDGCLNLLDAMQDAAADDGLFTYKLEE